MGMHHWGTEHRQKVKVNTTTALVGNISASRLFVHQPFVHQPCNEAALLGFTHTV